MTAPAPSSRPRITVGGLAIVGIGVLLLVVSIRQAGWDTIVASVRGVGAWFLAVIALGAARMAVRARAWSLCSRQTSGPRGIPFRAAFAATLAADALGNLTPLGLLASEPTKVVMGRRHVSTVDSLSSVTVENAFYTASVVLMLLGGVWVLLQRAMVPPALARVGEGIVALSALGVVVAFWAFRTRPAVLSRAGHLLARVGRSRLTPDALAAIEGQIYDVVHWPARRLGAIAAWEALFHVLAVAEVWLILRTMPGGQQTTMVEAFLLETTGRFITVAFKFIPYRLGVDELGSGSVSQLLGLGTPVGVALALVRRVRILMLNAVGIGLLARSSSAAGASR